MTIARPNILPLGLITIALALTACGGGGGGGGGSTATSTSSKAESSLPISSKADSSLSTSVSTSVVSSIVATTSSSSSSAVSSIVATTSSSSSSADTTPAAFSFTATTDAALSTAIISGTITLSGFDAAVPVSISGGEFSINGGTFTSAAGTVSPAQTLAVKVVSSKTNSTAVDAIVTVGGVSATYRVTTLADAIPTAFTFTPVTNAAPSSVNTSNTITIEGIDTAAPIAITGGEYSINGGAFTSAAGTVTNGQTIAVKAVAAAGTELTQSAVVTIGGVSGTYSVTTLLDTTAPIAEFKFPTPYTMSEATSVKVRGTAIDDHVITSVKVVVNGVDVPATPKVPGDFSSWTADVPLTANAENEIKVVATDDRNNQTAIEAANEVNIRQAPAANAFPDEGNQFTGATGIVLDRFDGRNRLLITASHGSDEKVIAVDLATGSRSIAFEPPDCSLFGLAIDSVSKHIFGTCYGNLYEFNLDNGALVNTYPLGFTDLQTIPAITIDRNNGRAQLVLVERPNNDVTGRVFAFSLDTKTFSVISAADQLPKFQSNESVIADGDQYLVPGGRFDTNYGGHIISVNAFDGTHTIVSDNTIGIGDLYSGYLDDVRTAHLSAIAKDSKNNRLFVFEFWTNKIFMLSLPTFNRQILMDTSYKQEGTGDSRVASVDMKFDDITQNLFIADWRRNAILIVDTETGDKVILSKSQNNF